MNMADAQLPESTLQAEDGHDQYLTFMLATEEYGVDILSVQEIKGWDGVTPMPNMPEYILGVINLRGTVVPIVDLRKLFHLESIAFDKTTVVIVVRVTDEEQNDRIMGMVVDAVSEVHNIAKPDVKPAPDFGGAISVDSIKGLSTQNDRMLILLDIDHLLNKEVLESLEQDSAASGQQEP